jgi:hypothetical protein
MREKRPTHYELSQELAGIYHRYGYDEGDTPDNSSMPTSLYELIENERSNILNEPVKVRVLQRIGRRMLGRPAFDPLRDTVAPRIERYR